MQFLETTAFGTRSAVWTLKSSDISPKITLFPMVHIGDEDFYNEVNLRVADLQLVLTEGVESKTSRFITYSYRSIVENAKIGLVLQKDLAPEQYQGEIIHADVSSSEFESEWKKIPILSRLRLFFLFPIFGVYLRFFGTRQKVAKGLNTEFAFSRADLLGDDQDWEEARSVLLDWRDVNLIRVLDDVLRRYQAEDIGIGIVYGAEHMRAVMKFLSDEYNYTVINSEWLDVIKL